MSEEFVSGCIQHRDTRHLRLYYDYMDIYSDNEYKAKIIRILETWTDHKRTEWYKTNSDRLEQGQEFLEPDFWITMSYQQFRYYMRHTASEDTLKKALVELEQVKHIKRRVNPDFPYGPPQYLLNSKVIQAALNKLSTPPLVPDLPPQEDTPPPGKNIPPQEITPTQGVELPPPRGEKTRGGGRKNTPTQGGKFGTSNITTKNYLEGVIDSNKEESTGEQSEKDTSASPHVDAALPDFPLITYADCITYLKLRGVSPQGDAVQVMVQARTLYVSDRNDTHSQQGDTHATAAPLHRPFSMAANQPALPGEAIVASQPRTSGDLGTSHGVQPVSERAVPTTRPVLEAAPEIDLDFLNAETEHRLPAIPKSAIPPGGTSHEQNRDASPRNVAVEPGLGVASSAPIPPALPEVSPPRTMRATVVPSPPKWDAQAMLARAEVLRDKPFSESARPKETKAARKLFARKPDLTEEEFTSAFQHWNTPWWHETNGPFCITDLAAVPKNKSEMRLIIALEKLAMPKKPPGGQVIQMPTTRGQQWRSSFDDPDYDMSAEFYPSEAERSRKSAAAK